MDRATSRLNGGYLILPLLIGLLLILPGWRPLSMTLYRLWEPHLAVPLDDQAPDHLRIRNDAYGRGDFGAKRRGTRRHAGVDLLASSGSAVRAARSGWATTDYRRDGYGHLVIIRHPDGSETRYAHLSRVDIADGQWVWQEQPVGAVGKTGNAGHYRGILPHLHFEVRQEGVAIDPMPLFAVSPPSWRQRFAAIIPASSPERRHDATR